MLGAARRSDSSAVMQILTLARAKHHVNQLETQLCARDVLSDSIRGWSLNTTLRRIRSFSP